MKSSFNPPETGEGGRAVLYGEYRCALDDKGRLNFPAKFREVMGERFFITSWLDNCVGVFPIEEWDRISEKMAGKSMAKSRKLNRFIFGGATEAVPDKQGRVLVPPPLRKHAALDKEIVVIGTGRYAEIWDADAFDAMKEELTSESAEAMMEELEI